MNRLSWPPLRSDIGAVICIGVLTYCLIADQWPGLAAFSLAGVIFCAVSPRMKGYFGLSGAGVQIGGEFVNPLEATRLDDAKPELPADPA